MEYKDYYEFLSVEPDTNVEDIKKAYRKLARKYHPDVNPNDEAARQRFNEINEANEVLTDPAKRAKYDQLTASWQAYQQTASENDFDWSQWITDAVTGSPVNLDEILRSRGGRSTDFSDFFEAVFGDISTAPVSPSPGQDYTRKIEITLEEAFNGVSRILRIGDRRLEIKIPRGAKAGTKVRIRGEGSEGVAGGPKGDLYLDIEITPHPIFERMGDDLYTELPVDLYTAVLGGEATVPTFKGKIKLRIPPETQSGRTFRLKGQGMPHLKHPDQRGDLYAKAMVKLPENLTPAEIALFEELADMRGM
jgi:curved DNA-binding protein